jgi:hypothetical protein
MKHTKLMAIVTLLLLGSSGAAAQSLGDYARAARKSKAETSSTTRHYDNDNLPTNETLSVVGPPPGADAKAEQKAAAVGSSAATAERQKTADEWNNKIAQQKAKIDSLNHDLDLYQRELHLRDAAVYSDSSAAALAIRLAQYKTDIDAKQKAIDAARQQLDEMQEQARKAGVAANELDETSNKDNIKDKE